MLDLQPFCGSDASRPYVMKPFSHDGFTWATDGRILLRVSLRAGVPALQKKLNVSGPLAGLESATFFKPGYRLPPAPDGKIACVACDGRGSTHDCPSCGCVCRVCNGMGEIDPEAIMSATIGSKFYVLRYVRMVLSLPGVELQHVAPVQGLSPLLFRFAEGIGALMPLTSTAEGDAHVVLRTEEVH